MKKATRREKQFHKLETAAYMGEYKASLLLYKSEARYWQKHGFIVTGIMKGKIVINSYHDVSFHFPQLMEEPEAKEYVYENGPMPENYTDSQKLFLIAERARYRKGEVKGENK